MNDYGPLETLLGPGTEKQIGASGGRPTNSDLSYFNLELPTAQGVIIVVGWPGQWTSQWKRDADVGLRVRAGQELTHFTLLPGEEVRTPLVVLQFWHGSWIRAQNVWRRWMLAHNVPRAEGHVPQPELFGCRSHLYNEMVDANEENQKMCLDRYLDKGIAIGRWWMDAGWYPCEGVGWPKVGTWEVDTKRFPHGLRAISDYAHSKGVKTIVWFEPERVHPDTWLTKNHPEWILGGVNGGLLNLGNPEARQWLTDHVDQLLTKEGIDLYRQDFNMDPLGYWRANDGEDRQGITEIRHVEGYLAYWDELRRRHPGMLIDSCASGGRRNDLETMRRAIPLWRTDYRCEPVGTQCCTLRHLTLDPSLRNRGGRRGRLHLPQQHGSFHKLSLRRAERASRLRPAAPAHGPVEPDRRMLPGRLLSADRIQHEARCLDGLAVRPAGARQRIRAGLPPRQVHFRGRPAQTTGTAAGSPIPRDRSGRRRIAEKPVATT